MHNVLSIRSTMSLTLCDGATLPVDADWEYDALDPCAVRLVLHLPGHPHTRVFARDLLLAGITHPSGEGQVHIRPVGICDVAIQLRSPSGDFTLRTQAATLAAFLLWTDQVVPVGGEAVTAELDTRTGDPFAPAPDTPTGRGRASYTLRLEHGRLTLSWSGALDRSQESAMARAARALDRPGDVRVDLSAVTSVDSTGLDFLARLRHCSRRWHAALGIVGPRSWALCLASAAGARTRPA